MTYVEVAIAKVHSGGKTFSYQSAEPVAIGDVVKVPFGNKQAHGVVLSIVKKPTFKTKGLSSVYPFRLSSQSIDLMLWMFDFYPDDPGSITQLFLASNFLKSESKKTAQILRGHGEALPIANTDQKKALATLKNKSSKRFLLHGDTGTGKTRVYLEMAQKILSTGKSVLVLAPEIGLAPQLVDDLKKHVSAPIVLTHSSLSVAERRRVWEYALKGQEPTVYVGPRSALFLPFNKLGLIVIDEAHDNSYKQGQAPRYQSLYVASKLAGLHDSILVQSTATPNVSDYEIAKNTGYKIIRMIKLAAGEHTNSSHIVDMTNRQNYKRDPYISDSLYEAAKKSLANGEQVMLFLNRRGSARLVQCNNCGWRAVCPHCGLPLTYHHDNHVILCHACNHKEPAPSSCPICKSTDLIFKSIGTKSLVDRAAKLFPDSRIMRFDADSAADEQYFKHINAIKNREVDIIIGTQIISKGIDLPHLGVVGVINADSGLNLPDYRAEETTFQQLYQVTGRTVRGHRPSKSFIQTRVAEHPVIQSVSSRSWDNFYKYELDKRRKFNYPPTCYLAIFRVRKKTDKGAEAAATKAYNVLQGLAGLQLLGPSPSFYERSGGTYSWQIVAKSKKRSVLINAAHQLTSGWVCDLDPTSLL